MHFAYAGSSVDSRTRRATNRRNVVSFRRPNKGNRRNGRRLFARFASNQQCNGASMRTLTPEKREKVLQLSARGWTPTEVASEVDVSAGSVYAALRAQRRADELAAISFEAEPNWREIALQSTRLLCLKRPQTHGLQRISRSGTKLCLLACGCSRETVKPQVLDDDKD